MARFTAVGSCDCDECGELLLNNEEHVCGKDLVEDKQTLAIREALENLLANLGWATRPDNPDGLFLAAQLMLLRRSIWNAYKALGFTDEELKGYLFK